MVARLYILFIDYSFRTKSRPYSLTALQRGDVGEAEHLVMNFLFAITEKVVRRFPTVPANGDIFGLVP